MLRVRDAKKKNILCNDDDRVFFFLLILLHLLLSSSSSLEFYLSFIRTQSTSREWIKKKVSASGAMRSIRAEWRKKKPFRRQRTNLNKKKKFAFLFRLFCIFSPTILETASQFTYSPKRSFRFVY